MVINPYERSVAKKKEFALSKQLSRNGTAIGVSTKEAGHAQSKANFPNKTNIAFKEANETEYRSILMKNSDFSSQIEFNSIHADHSESIRLIANIIKTTKHRLIIENFNGGK